MFSKFKKYCFTDNPHILIKWIVLPASLYNSYMFLFKYDGACEYLETFRMISHIIIWVTIINLVVHTLVKRKIIIQQLKTTINKWMQ